MSRARVCFLRVCVCERVKESAEAPHPILLIVSFRAICPLRQHSSSVASTVTVRLGVEDRHVVL